MRNKILKVLLGIALSGTILISNAGAALAAQLGNEADIENYGDSNDDPDDEPSNVENLDDKIVTYSTLDTVTGITYDAESAYIYWNKVKNATDYKLTITNKTTGEVRTGETSTAKYDEFESEFNTLEGNYEVSIYAENNNVYYLCGSDMTYKEATDRELEYDIYVIKDSTTGKSNFYRHPRGQAVKSTFTIQAKQPTPITALSKIRKKESQEDGVVFEIVNPPTLNQLERIEWMVSNNSDFLGTGKGNYVESSTSSSANATFRVSYDSFSPGTTIYVKARAYKRTYDDVYDRYRYEYGTETKVLTVDIPKLIVSGVNTNVSATSITLAPYNKVGSATGYEYSKKIGSKWVSLGTYTNKFYKDTGLSKNKKYKYRVRGYLYNKSTKKTTWSSWYYVNTVTWGASLQLAADVSNASSIKLNWSEAADAEGYEIYRAELPSSANTKSTDKLLKTIKKSSIKTYIDKKAKKGVKYTYTVKAYRTIDDKKCYISEAVTAGLKMSNLEITNKYYTSSGRYKVVWKKLTGFKGIRIEKFDKSKGRYVTVKTLKASSTSYTFKPVSPKDGVVEYRVRPYDSAATYDGVILSVSPQLAVVQNVKATKVSDGIKVTWSPVKNADYYMVYRTLNGDSTSGKATNSYSMSDAEIVYDAAIDTTNCDPSKRNGAEYNYVGTYKKSNIEGTSVIDRTLTYKVKSKDEEGKYIEADSDDADEDIAANTGEDRETLYQTEDAIYNEGPEPGVKYFYYVIACAKIGDGKTSYNGSNVVSSIGYSKPAEAIYTNVVVKKVSEITSIKTGRRTATIKYKKVGGVSGYAIYRSTTPKGEYSLVGTTTKTAFTDRDLVAGKTYYYKVASYAKGEAKANIYSAKTAYKKVKIK